VTVIALDLNDAGVVAANASGMLAPPSPGFALIEGSSIAVGGDAAGSARLKPRKIHDRFWKDIDTTTLKRPFPNHLTTADLVHRHLQQIWENAGASARSVLLAVPGSFNERQLGLILGIARSCRIPVTGMVDAAVAAVLGSENGTADLVHLDLQLHTVVATRIERRARLSRVRVVVDDRLGLTDLQARWAAHIAADFVRTTRFDPLHLAASEQCLYDQLPTWFRELQTSPIAIFSMEAGGRRYAIELSREEMAEAVHHQYDEIAETVRAMRPGEAPLTLVVSDRIALLPGLVARLSHGSDTTVSALPPAAAAIGAARAADQIVATTDSLPFVTSLDIGANASRIRDDGETGHAHVSSPAVGHLPPTHIVCDGAAYPISEERFVIGASIPDGGRGLQISKTTARVSHTHCTVVRRGAAVVLEDHSTYGTTVNGRRVAGPTELAAGDIIRVGSPGVELLMISTVE
jgi:hypothetical protein